MKTIFNCFGFFSRACSTRIAFALALFLVGPMIASATPSQANAPLSATPLEGEEEGVVAYDGGFGTPGNHGCCELYGTGTIGKCKLHNALIAAWWDCESDAGHAESKMKYHDCEGKRPWSNLSKTECRGGLNGGVEVCKNDGDPCVLGTYTSNDLPNQKCIHHKEPKVRKHKDSFGNLLDGDTYYGECVSASSTEGTW